MEKEEEESIAAMRRLVRLVNVVKDTIFLSPPYDTRDHGRCLHPVRSQCSFLLQPVRPWALMSRQFCSNTAKAKLAYIVDSFARELHSPPPLDTEMALYLEMEREREKRRRRRGETRPRRWESVAVVEVPEDDKGPLPTELDEHGCLMIKGPLGQVNAVKAALVSLSVHPIPEPPPATLKGDWGMGPTHYAIVQTLLPFLSDTETLAELLRCHMGPGPGLLARFPLRNTTTSHFQRLHRHGLGSSHSRERVKGRG